MGVKKMDKKLKAFLDKMRETWAVREIKLPQDGRKPEPQEKRGGAA